MSVIIHVPHAGDGMPEELMESVVVSRGEFDHLHEKMKDFCREILRFSQHDSDFIRMTGKSFDWQLFI